MKDEYMSNQPMDKKLLNVCGVVGAIITFFVTMLFIRIIFHSLYPSRFYNSMLLGANLSVSLLMASIGYIAGRMGGKNPMVVSAFQKGGAWFCFAAAIYVIPINIIIYCETSTFEQRDRFYGYFYFGVFLLFLSTATGSLVFGAASIFARDYRQFGRMRGVPQFTMSEIMTVTFLIAVIISAIVSIRYFAFPKY
jgi:hypothetical protein